MPRRRSGSNISAMAVKKDMNSPTVFSPAMISRPPKYSTPKNPIPVITSISPGISAFPSAACVSVFTRVSSKLS